MSLFLVSLFALAGILLGKHLFKKWFNHLTLYSIIMGGLTFFYELKLLPYPDLIPMTWFCLISAFLSFTFGIVTVFSARNLYPTNQSEDSYPIASLPIFADGGKLLKYSILVFSFIGLFVALHRWSVLIGKFGSIQAVLLNAGLVYRLNVQGEIKEFIPILPSFVYVAVFLAGIYTAYKGRFSFLSLFPIICIVLKELTYFGRGEMLFSSMMFLFTFFLTRHLLQNDSPNKFKFSRANAAIAVTILFALLIAAASFVRISRGAQEKYVGASRELRQMQEDFIVSPSVYLYLSSDVGVFTKYLEADGEPTRFGENTFKAFYFFLARFNIVEKPYFFQKGYFIPMWTNTGTYIRELHADFGPAGVFIGSYFLGFIITWLWFKFFEKRSLYMLVFLVYFLIIVGFSFLMMVTRLNLWFLSQLIILLYLPILNTFAKHKAYQLNKF